MIQIEAKNTKLIASGMIITLGLTLFLSGCVGGASGMAPEEVVLNSILKAENISQYKTSGEMTMEITSGGNSMDVSGNFTTYAVGDKARTDIKIGSMQGVQEVEGRTFVLPNGTYSCSQETGEWVCQKGSQSMPTSLTMKSEETKELIEKGAVKFPQSSAEEKTINGRTCYYVEMNIDENILQQQTQGLEQSQSVEGMQINQCYDKETGVALYGEVRMDMAVFGQSAEMIMKTESKSFQFDGDLDLSEGLFELPAEPTALNETMPENYTEQF